MSRIDTMVYKERQSSIIVLDVYICTVQDNETNKTTKINALSLDFFSQAQNHFTPERGLLLFAY
jgi:hypothetical protein